MGKEEASSRAVSRSRACEMRPVFREVPRDTRAIGDGNATESSGMELRRARRDARAIGREFTCGAFVLHATRFATKGSHAVSSIHMWGHVTACGVTRSGVKASDTMRAGPCRAWAQKSRACLQNFHHFAGVVGRTHFARVVHFASEPPVI
jgi:hypothetical protein